MLVEYLELWDLVTEVELQPDVSDIRRWRFTESGQYSSKSAYRSLFIGSITFEPWELLRKLEDLGTKEMFFFLWLVAHNRCWTADRLALRTTSSNEMSLV